MGVSLGHALMLMGLSVALYVCGWTILILWREGKDNKRISFTKRGVLFAIMLLGATTIARFVVGMTGKLEQGLLPWPEELVNSFMHALQSFTMDESYTEYLIKGNEGFGALAPDTCFATIYSIYDTVLNLSCAITSQVALVAVIANVFPRVKLLLVSLRFWKPVCYFSELNPESISLAKSIRESKEKRSKANLVFCNADTDSDEIPQECFEKARELGAIMTRISLSELKLHRRKGKTFFLTGKDEDNLAILSGFTEQGRIEKFKENDSIYVFANDNYGTLVEKTVRNAINAQIKEKTGDANKKITLFNVNRYKSIVYNLIEEKPLFSALSGDSKELKVAIFGSGKIGTEMFLATYWCGQMLDRELKITVVSDETEEHFRRRIDHINSDILKTAENDNELLRIRKNSGEKADPYMSFDYIESDVYLDGLDDMLTACSFRARMDEHESIEKNLQNGKLADFDYFVVALGSDKKSMEVSERIGRVVTVNSDIKRKDEARVPIACALWSDELSDTVKKMNKTGLNKVDIEPFGSMDSSFNIEKVLLDIIKERAIRLEDKYEQNIAKQKGKNYEDDPYKYWANVSRAIHLKYKAFCVSKSTDAYLSEAKEGGSFDNRAHELAWLEHRRWNAFMRTEGFKCPGICIDDEGNEAYGYIMELPREAAIIQKNNKPLNSGNHKSLDLKLHPCIVECDKNGMHSDLFDKERDGYEIDLLDDVSVRLKNIEAKYKLEIEDFKKYDYPQYE